MTPKMPTTLWMGRKMPPSESRIWSEPIPWEWLRVLDPLMWDVLGWIHNYFSQYKWLMMLFEFFLFCLPHWVHNSRSSTTSTGKWGHGLITRSTPILELGYMTYPCTCPHSGRWEIGCTFILRKLLVCLWIHCWICCHNICRSVHVCAYACACVGLHPMRKRNKMRHSRKEGGREKEIRRSHGGMPVLNPEGETRMEQFSMSLSTKLPPHNF